MRNKVQQVLKIIGLTTQNTQFKKIYVFDKSYFAAIYRSYVC